jgi:hypothetical protein
MNDKSTTPSLRSPGPPSSIGGLFETLVYTGGWPFRLRRALGLQPRLRTVRHRIDVSGQAGIPRPLRIAYASDFHAGATTDPDLLEEAYRALRAAEPDVLLLGGDFVSTDKAAVDSVARALGSIPAPYGRFAVLGNHDWWCGADHITACLESAGIDVLTNRSTRLAPPYQWVSVCGLDDHWLGQPDATAATDGADGYRVVLMHAPSGLLDLGAHRFDLALCGHTHGGQIALPGGVPLLVPNGSLSRRYARGRFELGDGRTLVVSLGVGCVLLPFRLFSDPEIIVAELHT